MTTGQQPTAPWGPPQPQWPGDDSPTLQIPHQRPPEAGPPPPPPNRRKWPFVAGAVVALAAVAALVVALTAGRDPMPVTSTVSPTSTTNPPPALQRTPEQAYVADILDTPGLTSTMSDVEMTTIGKGACEVMAYQQYTRADLVAQLGQSKLGPQVMGVIVDAAHRNLCPQYTFPSTTTTGSTTSGDASTTGPASGTVSDGTYLVGEDLDAGTWKTSGDGGTCYWARLSDDSGSDIIANNYGSGPSRFTTKKGEVVELSGGCTWTKQG